jgi:hypothetical protein
MKARSNRHSSSGTEPAVGIENGGAEHKGHHQIVDPEALWRKFF